ncbi:MAG: phosphoribosylglycinamide formyltransferase, partial [Flavobacteriia bacterium]|nr:phosphoribosylglycinamide formyltransferase [Flavobacteriia bacterium]
MYGHHVHQKVFENKERTTGITIHLVNEHYDEG